MQIPLDYYRILGLPLAASEEQLRQAYSDRIVQLPRREYSIASVSSRKQLIEEAYVVLSNPKERSNYDQLYLAYAYNQDRVGETHLLGSSKDSISRNHDVQRLSIEIAEDELVGALLLLQELGEYELVLKLGRPHLVNRNNPPGVKAGYNLDSEEFFSNPELPDIILTVALACLELGREQWQQGNYHNAAISLETGEELLVREGLFPNVQAEIADDLSKLRPYRILELLQLPLEKTKERREGLDLLRTILRDRGGIDGAGNDQTGLNIDDFLRFIQQLRNHLTVAEQHKLFESESKRPSAVSTYLAVYALIARGFFQRQPALIRQAKEMLIGLGKRQDVHLEQSLCALLLGQTEEATRVLELSQEYEALAIIREKSQDSPDLLPGLCVYCEQWLQQEVFPNFRDLIKQRASLKEYFADKQVQAYLEALPIDTVVNDDLNTVNKQPSQSSTINSAHLGFAQYGGNNTHSRNYQYGINGVGNRTVNQKYKAEPQLSTPSMGEIDESQYIVSETQWDTGSVENNSQSLEMPIEESRSPEKIGGEYYYQMNVGGHSDGSNHTKKRRRRRPILPHGRDPRQERKTLANRSARNMRLVWLVFLSVGGLFVFWLLVSTVWSWFNNVFFPQPSVQGIPLAIELNQPPIAIPEPSSIKPEVPEGQLTTAIAQEVIEKWLSTKAAALGPERDTKSLDEILTDSAASKWRLVLKSDIAEKRYRKYEHDVKIDFVIQESPSVNNAVVEATVKEVTIFYVRGNRQRTTQERLRVRYGLIRKQGLWRIEEMTVVKSLKN